VPSPPYQQRSNEEYCGAIRGEFQESKVGVPHQMHEAAKAPRDKNDQTN
jgi:hypothetical protein